MFLTRTCFWTAQVLCATLLTVVAGMPQWSCLCPSGQVKPFCLGSASATTKCCCGGGCCAQSDGAAPASTAKKQGCCCCQQKHRGTSTTGVESTGCKKALVSSDFKALASTRTVLAEDGSTGLFLIAPQTEVLVFSPAPGQGRFYPQCTRPPPTDLVVAFQHFLI